MVSRRIFQYSEQPFFCLISQMSISRCGTSYTVMATKTKSVRQSFPIWVNESHLPSSVLRAIPVQLQSKQWVITFWFLFPWRLMGFAKIRQMTWLCTRHECWGSKAQGTNVGEAKHGLRSTPGEHRYSSSFLDLLILTSTNDLLKYLLLSVSSPQWP